LSNKKWILPVIVIAQFCCTSLWFASNGAINDLIANFQLSYQALGHLTSVIQFGFITGTLTFAVLTIADRFSPSHVFFVCGIAGALLNLSLTWDSNTLTSLLIFRFLTGFFLAGIYPIGMKIAADYYQKGLGKSLGFLVGALVLGTALPHLLKGITTEITWKSLIFIISGLAVIGSFLILLLVADGPYRKKSQQPDFSQWLSVFKHNRFRAAAFGYFGHMWELYAFWAFIPVILNYKLGNDILPYDISILSFVIIGIGSLGCVVGGYLSERYGTQKIATIALCLSLICCLISPIMLSFNNPEILIVFLLFWGIVVIADSPLFSTLVATNANPQSKGTALTIVNCIGFAITIISIQLLNYLNQYLDLINILWLLAIGPIIGLIFLMSNTKATTTKL